MAADVVGVVFGNKIIIGFVWDGVEECSGELLYLLLKRLVFLADEFSLLVLLLKLLALAD